MHIGVTGPRGMLGQQVIRALLRTDHEGIAMDGNIIDFARMSQYKPDVVINCAGITHGDPVRMIESNAIGPYILSRLGIPILHVSTDCVFSGHISEDKVYYRSCDPDPTTTYGRSKLLGEVDSLLVCNVRTSFIGKRSGLLRWLLDQEAARGKESVEGYTGALWTGSTVQEVAKRLVEIAPFVQRGDIRGIQHLSTTRVMSKYEVLHVLKERLGLKIDIYAKEYSLNRALMPSMDLRDITEVEEI